MFALTRGICEVRQGKPCQQCTAVRLLSSSQLPPEFLRLGCSPRAGFHESWRRIVQSARLGCRVDQESDGAKFRAVHDGVRGGNKRHGSCELARFPGHAQWGAGWHRVRRSLHQLHQVHQSQLRPGIPTFPSLVLAISSIYLPLPTCPLIVSTTKSFTV